MTLLEQYEAQMEKTAAEAQTVEVLTKYASFADNLLAAEYGEDYTKDDVIELASKLIEHDSQLVAGTEKTASEEDAVDAEVEQLIKIGRVIGLGIKQELSL